VLGLYTYIFTPNFFWSPERTNICKLIGILGIYKKQMSKKTKSKYIEGKHVNVSTLFQLCCFNHTWCIWFFSVIHMCSILQFKVNVITMWCQAYHLLKHHTLSDLITDIFFKFLMLHHSLASQQRFSIKLLHVFRTCLKSKKDWLKNVTKLKSESKCDDLKKIKIKLMICPIKKGNIATKNIPFLFLFLLFWRNFTLRNPLVVIDLWLI